jgi:hypothetical protein
VTMKRLRRVLTGIAVSAAMMVTVVAGSATAAQAAADPGYWPNNPEICRSSCSNPTNLVMFWQSILWADSQGTAPLPDEFIDGDFGGNTRQATWRWQAYIGRVGENGRALATDGRVGRNTWYAAWRWVNNGDPNTDGCEYDPWTGTTDCMYWGAVPGRSVYYVIDLDGVWMFKNPRTDEWVTIN